MYATLVTLHSLIRWAVVVVAVVAVLYALYGFFTKPDWRSLGDTLGSLFTWTVRINLLLGIVLWVWRLTFPNGFSVFYHVIHAGGMFIALALAEIFAARRRNEVETARWRPFLLGTLVPTLLIFAVIPWGR